MIFIKTLEEFLLTEALKDEIPKHLSDIVSKRYDNKYLDLDIPEHTSKIPNVKIEIKDDNLTDKSISEIVDYFTENIIDQYKKSDFFNFLVDEKNNNFYNVFIKSLDMGRHPNPNFKIEMFDYLKKLYSNSFKLLDNKSTSHDLVFSNNKSNLFNLIKSYNNMLKRDSAKMSQPHNSRFPTLKDLYDTIGYDLTPITYNPINDKVFNGLIDVVNKYEQNIEKIKSHKLFLYITDKPTDKLLMSVSKFYSSCQNIYTGGDEGTEYNKKLLSNVFDPNTKIALLIFDTPYTDQKGNKVSYTSIARTLIRYDEESDKIMFDKTYPSDMQSVMYNIITEYTGLENKGKYGDIYNFKGVKGLDNPYMDLYRLKSDTSLNKFEAISKYFEKYDYDITQESDIRFIVNDEEAFEVYTESEAMEYTRDYFREFENWFDILVDKSVETCLINDFFDVDNIIDIFSHKFKPSYNLQYDVDSVEIKNICKYLQENGIITVDDMINNLQRPERNQLIVKVDNIISTIGEEESRNIAISNYDSNEYRIEYAGIIYFFYRTNL